GVAARRASESPRRQSGIGMRLTSGLRGCGSRVCVGPPLLASAAKPGAPAFSRSPWAVFVNPHVSSSEKLNPLDVVDPTPNLQLIGTGSLPNGNATTDPKTRRSPSKRWMFDDP